MLTRSREDILAVVEDLVRSSGVSSRLMQRSSVDLPEPEEPMMQVTSPLSAAKVDALEHFVVAEGLAQMPLTSITRSIS